MSRALTSPSFATTASRGPSAHFRFGSKVVIAGALVAGMAAGLLYMRSSTEIDWKVEAGKLVPVVAAGVFAGLTLVGAWFTATQHLPLRARRWSRRGPARVAAFALSLLLGTSGAFYGQDQLNAERAARAEADRLRAVLDQVSRERDLDRSRLDDALVQLEQLHSIDRTRRQDGQAMDEVLAELQALVRSASEAETSASRCAGNAVGVPPAFDRYFGGPLLASVRKAVADHCLAVAEPATLTTAIVIFSDGRRFEIGSGADPHGGRQFYAFGTERLVVDGEAQTRAQVYTIWAIAGERRIVAISEVMPERLLGKNVP